MFSNLNLLTETSSFSGIVDMIFSPWAIVAYIAIVIVIVIAIIVIAIKKDAKTPKVVHNIDLSDSISVKAEGSFVGGGGKSEEDDDIEDRSRFYMLSELDANRGRFYKTDYNDGVTLKILCDEFRSFACSKLKLYYSIADIRKFIAGMSVSKIVILQGMSGTGKTSLAYAMGEFIGNPSTVIPVQPMWKERTDLVGYYNDIRRNEYRKS